MNLVDITKENWLKIVFLTTNENGHATITEKFVASNALSIVQSMFESGWIIKGIQVDEKLIGFTMYGFSEDYSKYEICRLMIDRKYQEKGYGKKAIGMILEEMKKIEDCDAIYLSTEPENGIARKLYESFGFKETGEIIEGEVEYCLKLV
ncbi:GNAT family N-acetyltransferase [Psychrobacillus sp. FJAT-51614]|uniref:GNAT family N-acetyltransferase n=1 Tax=Psychrobacillus mangrovi TaxID=3117745 RepID=A0ABU8F5K3_9BACI